MNPLSVRAIGVCILIIAAIAMEEAKSGMSRDWKIDTVFSQMSGFCFGAALIITLL